MRPRFARPPEAGGFLITMQAITERRRRAHHAALEVLALSVGCTTPGLKLWRQLCRLERRVYAGCEAYTNAVPGWDLQRWQLVKEEGRAELAKIFGGKIPAGVYINGDPRGHSLKLDCDEAQVPEGLQRDMGGNGILAATIEEED